ncbi:MAG: glycosyltransferase [Flavobacterium sp.]|nr:glycosyltransferase [Flavobacterium sp.]
MNKIAVLLTCHNRKDKTLSCLNSLYRAYQRNNNQLEMVVYLTDDGSTDGTSEAVSEFYPEVNILVGNGNLYWAGGMRNSWNESLKIDFNWYLLLNDDTDVFEDLFIELEYAIEYCSKVFLKKGIIIGTTQDESTQQITYGGSVYINKFKGTFKILIPNSKYQKCELGNANIMFVYKDVVKQIGILSTDYVHGVADYDYTLSAIKNNIPVIIMPKFVGFCSQHLLGKNETLLSKKTIKDRIKYLNSPTGLAFIDTLHFQKKFFPLRFLFVFFAGYFKVFFPRFYVFLHFKLR